MNTGIFKTDEYILETTRPDTLEGTKLTRFSNSYSGENLEKAMKEYRRALADPEVSQVGLYRQRTTTTRVVIAVEGEG